MASANWVWGREKLLAYSVPAAPDSNETVTMAAFLNRTTSRRCLALYRPEGTAGGQLAARAGGGGQRRCPRRRPDGRADQAGRAAQLKAVGGSPGLVAAVLLAEQLAVAVAAGASC